MGVESQCDAMDAENQCRGGRDDGNFEEDSKKDANRNRGEEEGPRADDKEGNHDSDEDEESWDVDDDDDSTYVSSDSLSLSSDDRPFAMECTCQGFHGGMRGFFYLTGQVLDDLENDVDYYGPMNIDFDGRPERDDTFSERAGRVIGESQDEVTKLNLHYLDSHFCNGLASNRWLRHLHIKTADLSRGNLLSHLTPLFEKNARLRCLQIRDCCDQTEHTEFWMDSVAPISSENIDSLARALAKSNSKALERIDLGCNKISDGHMAVLLMSLHGYLNLRSIHLDANKLGIEGCKALGGLLAKDACALEEIYLGSNNIDDSALEILTKSLKTNESVKTIALGRSSFYTRSLRSDKVNPITVNGWRALSSVLSSPDRHWQGIFLGNTGLDDDNAKVLADALKGCTTLRKLDMSWNRNIGRRGWQTISNCLATLSGLEHLDIGDNRIDDVAAIVVANALARMKNLKTLTMCTCLRISPEAWQDLFRIFPAPESSLEKLNFMRGNRIDDEGLAILVEKLANISSVNELVLMSLPFVSSYGWASFANLLRSPNSKLQRINISENRLNDRAAVAIANALHENKFLLRMTMERGFFHIDEDDDEYELTGTGWSAFIDALCDTSSLDATFTSNHTFRGIYTEDLPDGLFYLLEMNELGCKRRVARKKIIEHHFPFGSDNINLFSGMELNVLPKAIFWICRERVDGLSLMYQLALHMPYLFEVGLKSATTEKRGQKRRTPSSI
ncbi:hypothetical protein ACHAWF_005640 [Thalassiosira exigua]